MKKIVALSVVITAFFVTIISVPLTSVLDLVSMSEQKPMSETVKDVGNNPKPELQDTLFGVKLSDIKDDISLGQYAVNMMTECELGSVKKSSDAHKIILAQTIVRVVNNVFEVHEHKKAYMAALAIESCFKRFSQSPTGPKGYAQVAKKAFKEGLELCGIPANEDDVFEGEINLLAGACYFRHILETRNNDPYFAIIGYNQGPNSSDIKSFSKNGRIESPEALKYLAKFTYLRRSIPDTKMPNAPQFSEETIVKNRN